MKMEGKRSSKNLKMAQHANSEVDKMHLPGLLQTKLRWTSAYVCLKLMVTVRSVSL